MTEIAMPEKAETKESGGKKKGAKKGGRSTPWRDNIEAILMAIVMAIVLKYFIVEAYRIPTGSMQPTLMGNSATGVYDRILVDKFTPVLRDPLRFETWVFRYPLDQSKNYVKRVVG
ncbi:MAG: signal peptidase I, partial [Planctomycetota bacterium]